jgi:hypothetical protein
MDISCNDLMRLFFSAQQRLRLSVNLRQLFH